MPDVELHCPSCKHNSPLPPQACPRCGAPMDAVRRRSSLSPIALIILLFLVLGPFGLGMLWRNDRLSRNAKWLLTALVLIYTAAIFWSLYVTVQWGMNEVEKAMNAFQF